MRPEALQSFPSVVSPHVDGADERTGLHIPSISLATSGCFPSHCPIDASDLVDKSPAPAVSARCTIGLGGSGREQLVAAVKPKSTPIPKPTCFSRFTPLFSSDYHLMTSCSKGSVVPRSIAGLEELLGSGCRCSLLLNLGGLIGLLA